jgi:purine-binding chemotaxis protein CheW
MTEVSGSSLLCRLRRGVLCALPLRCVGETMRPLPVTRIVGAPAFVQGLAVVRGVPTAVLDAAALLSGQPSRSTRFVTVNTGGRSVALAVDAVIGVVDIPAGDVEALPPLYQNRGADAIAAIGRFDEELLLVLQSSRLMTEEVWAIIHAAGTDR